MKYIASLITVNDIARARDFYENVLGLKVKADFGENVTFEGDFSIHLKEHFKTLINGVEIHEKANNFELYLEHDDLEEVSAKIRESGLEFIHDIKEQPWKQMVMRFYDYDNNMIEIGERMEHTAYRLHKQGYSTDEIMRYTYFDKKAVEDAIKEYSGSL